MPSRSKSDLNEILVDAYEKACAEYLRLYADKPQPFLTCSYRSNDEQNALYAQGRTTKGAKVTNAKGSESPHNYNPSAAFDIGFITLGKKLDWSPINFKNFADIILKIQPLVEWGGAWKTLVDVPHFQLRNWKTFIK